jgi:hypothetical protein
MPLRKRMISQIPIVFLHKRSTIAILNNSVKHLRYYEVNIQYVLVRKSTSSQRRISC